MDLSFATGEDNESGLSGLASGQCWDPRPPECLTGSSPSSSSGAVLGLMPDGHSSDSAPSSHRPKHLFSPTNYLGLVTKTIPANSPEFHSPKGKKAIFDEVDDLRGEQV